MKILPPRSVASLIATCFLVLSTFSFGMPPMVDDPYGRDLQDGNQQQQINQETRDRGATDPDDGGSTNSDEELRESGFPAIAENDSGEQNKQYRSRKDFAAYLAADIGKFSQQLEFSQQLVLAEAEQAREHPKFKKREKKSVTINPSANDDENVSTLDSAGEQRAQLQRPKLKEDLFLKKIIKTASRLSAKYASEEVGNEVRMMTPSIGEMQAKVFPILDGEETSYDMIDSWPTKEMTPLEADEEYYEAFKQKEEEALQFLAQDQAGEALYCHNSAVMLDRLSQHLGSPQESDDSDDDDSRFIEVCQQSISLSLLLKNPGEIKAMRGDEKNAELLLFDVVTAIQEKLQNEENASTLLSLVQQYRHGGLRDNPSEFCIRYKTLLAEQSERAKAETTLQPINLLDNFNNAVLFEDQRGLVTRANNLMWHYKNDSNAIYGHVTDCIGELTEQLKKYLPRKKKSGAQQDFLLRLLEEQVLKTKHAQAQEPLEEEQQWVETKQNVLRFEALQPFVREKTALLRQLISSEHPWSNDVTAAWQTMTPEWNRLMEALDQQATKRAGSLQQGPIQIWSREEKESYIRNKRQALLQLRSSQPTFNEIGYNMLLGGLIGMDATLIAYELYLDFLPASSHAVSS